MLSFFIFFQVSVGREWYIHTIYTVRSRDNANRGIGKRSVEYHHITQHDSSRSRRSVSSVPALAEEIGAENERGTNILHVALERSSQHQPQPKVNIQNVVVTTGSKPEDTEDDYVLLIVGILLGLILTVVLLVLVFLLVRSRKEKEKLNKPPKGSSSTEPMMTHGFDSNDSSEV